MENSKSKIFLTRNDGVQVLDLITKETQYLIQ